MVRKMRMTVLALGLALAPAAALLAEQGQVIRSGDLLSEPFIDAARTARLKPSQPVTILRRQGGWIEVEAEGRTGWVRALNLRLAEGSVQGNRGRKGAGPKVSPTSVTSTSSALSLLRTGSSGRTTTTTGVKGLDEEDIRRASPDRGELAKLDGNGVDAANARAAAEEAGLVEKEAAYFDARGRPE